MTRSELKYQKAIKMLADEYRKAQANVWVYKPMAYALYQAWKWFDKHEKPRLPKAESEEARKNESVAISYCINIPDNATNGDVIKTLFPFVTKHISHSENNIYIDSPIQATILAFDRYWWNALYKGEEE